MRRMLALIVLAGLGFAQTWYYNVDQNNAFSPATLTFIPTAEQLLCAGLLEPGAVPAGGARVNDLSLPAGCPARPPVVVYATDPASGNLVYASVLTVKFWGEKRANTKKTGTDALIQVIKDGWGLQVDASGDLGKVDAQFLPPFTKPPVTLPPLGGNWYGWQTSQTVSFADPQVSEVHNYPKQNAVCSRLYGKRCWSAVFTWVLPVRLVLHGDETGSAQLTLTPGLFVRKTAATLNLRVRGDTFEQPELKPYAP